jgi:dephospho-CoA kinase
VLRIGLTGGIASGKSTVAAMFAELGACIVDTDVIAREVVEPGTPALTAIAEAFGPDVVDNGVLDRKRLGRIVFADSAQRRRLEAILHPLIRQTALQRSDQCAGPYVVLVVPLLFESGFDQLVDRALVVDCPTTVQIARLTARDEIGREAAESIIAAQMHRDERRARADDLIDTSSPVGATRARVAELHKTYVELSRNCPGKQGRAE